MDRNEEWKEQLKEKLRLVDLAIEFWVKLDEYNFGQIAHHDFTREYFIEICKVYSKGGCKISDFESGKCPVYRYIGKKCYLRDNYKNWKSHHDNEHRGDLRFISCKRCKTLRENEIEIFKEVKKRLESQISRLG